MSRIWLSSRLLPLRQNRHKSCSPSPRAYGGMQPAGGLAGRCQSLHLGPRGTRSPTPRSTALGWLPGFIGLGNPMNRSTPKPPVAIGKWFLKGNESGRTLFGYRGSFCRVGSWSARDRLGKSFPCDRKGRGSVTTVANPTVNIKTSGVTTPRTSNRRRRVAGASRVRSRARAPQPSASGHGDPHRERAGLDRASREAGNLIAPGLLSLFHQDLPSWRQSPTGSLS